jgi:hypothetical protein
VTLRPLFKRSAKLMLRSKIVLPNSGLSENSDVLQPNGVGD